MELAPLFVKLHRPAPNGISPFSIGLECSPYVVDLRTAWKTSHSVSTQRRNALLTATIAATSPKPSLNAPSTDLRVPVHEEAAEAVNVKEEGKDDFSAILQGFGEVGMPPKNRLAGYMADYDDVAAYAEAAVVGRSPCFSPDALIGALSSQQTKEKRDTATRGSPYTLGDDGAVSATLLLLGLLWVHDKKRCSNAPSSSSSSASCSPSCSEVKDKQKEERFGRAGVEGALLDALGKLIGAPSWALGEAWVSVLCSPSSSFPSSLLSKNKGTEPDKKGETKDVLIDQLFGGADSLASSATPNTCTAACTSTIIITDDALKAFVFSGVVDKFIHSAQHHAKNSGTEIGTTNDTTKLCTTANGTTTDVESYGYKGFLTVGMADPQKMAAGVKEALSQTPFIKIKLDGDERLSYERLLAIGAVLARETAVGRALCRSSPSFCTNTTAATAVAPCCSVPALASVDNADLPLHIVIDANAAWTPAKTMRFADNIVGRMGAGGLPPLVPRDGTREGNDGEGMEEVTLPSPANTCSGSSSDTFYGPRAVYQLVGRCVRMVEQPYPADFIHQIEACNGNVINNNNSAVSSDKKGDEAKAGEGAAPSSPQPPLSLSLSSALAKWADAKTHCNARGLKLFADESVCSSEDLPLLAPYVNGVNIKLEKCGGLLSAFEFVEATKAYPSIDFTWVGIMVGSRLLCNNAGQLLVRTKQGDVDGALLLTEASQQFSGGFEWCVDVATADEKEKEKERGAKRERDEGEEGGADVISFGPAHGTIRLQKDAVGVGCLQKKHSSNL